MHEGIVAALRALTDKQLVEVFYRAVEGRHIYQAEKNAFDARLVLANAVRDTADSDGPWAVELLCSGTGKEWADDSPICQHGRHCGLDTASWAKDSTCPLCGGAVHGT